MFLSIKNLNKYFGNNHVLNNVSTDLKKSELRQMLTLLYRNPNILESFILIH